MNHSIAQKNFQTNWQNQLRKAIVYLPQNFNENENLPLVINMHGFLTTSQFQFDYTQFHKLADSVRCIVVYPEGVGLRWNSGTFFFVPSTVDDVGFIGDWLDRAAVLYNANLKKAYSMGYSAGGFMSYKLACDATNRIAAIAPDVASMVNDNLSSCVPARPINIAAFNGLSDPITPYNGFPGNFPGIDSIKHFWQLKNGCDIVPIIDTMPDLANDGTRVVRYTYINCGQQVQQVYYKVIDGGHVWPGAANIFFNILGKTTQDISMNKEAWNFFKTKEIPGAVICSAPQNLIETSVSTDSFQVSWNSVAGVSLYKVALADDSDKVTFFETTASSFGFKINASKKYRWNVASLCSSGFHNWNKTKPLNYTLTSIKNKSENKIKIYPNPAMDFINLDLPVNELRNATIRIINSVGEVVKAKVLEGNILKIDDLSAGIYQLQIENETQNYTTTFIKQ
ncbi:MAG TPA: T9SS type A sorting domain-containing protein [Chitinophagales bacterium]|nr:T9SS type A sorting domain-containing protein [Chitinophagales bacterium]